MGEADGIFEAGSPAKNSFIMENREWIWGAASSQPHLKTPNDGVRKMYKWHPRIPFRGFSVSNPESLRAAGLALELSFVLFTRLSSALLLMK